MTKKKLGIKRAKTLKLKWSKVHKDTLDRLQSVDDVETLEDGSWRMTADYILNLNLEDTNDMPRDDVTVLRQRIRKHQYTHVVIVNDSGRPRMLTQ